MKRKLLSLVVTLVSVTSCGGAANIEAGKMQAEEEEKENSFVFDANYNGADFSNGELAFVLDKAFDESIETFEASIKLRKDANERSIIFGNYCYYNDVSTSKNTQNYEINSDGNLRVYWCGASIVFDEIDFRTGEWMHITVTRNKISSTSSDISLYVNDELMSTKNTSLNDVKPNGWRHRIGGDARENSTKYPFLGEIASITCYNVALDDSTIFEDFENPYSISHLNRGENLLFHTIISPLNDILIDTSIHSNYARAMTNDLFYNEPMYETEDYSFGLVGDTQILAQWAPENIDCYSNWAINNKEERKLQAMLYLGDLSNGRGDTETDEWRRQWENASRSMSLMDGKVPYIFVPGNHDYLKDSTYRNLDEFNSFYPYSKFSQTPYFAGAYCEGQMQNTYYEFEICGIKYLILAMEFGPDNDVLTWMDDVIYDHPDYRVIVMTHGFLGPNGELYSDKSYLSAYWYFSRQGIECNSSSDMWNRHLCKHRNLFMVLCGHSVTESVACKLLEGDNGNTVISLRLDPSYLIAGVGVDPVLGLMNFNESAHEVTLNYFSTQKGLLYNIQNQYRINFETYEIHTGSYYYPGREILR